MKFNVPQWSIASVIAGALCLSASEPAPACVESIPGLVGWWRGGNNSVVGGHVGSLAGGAAITEGRVGDGYSFNGSSGQVVSIPSSGPFQLQEFSIGAWIRRAEVNRSSQAGVPDGAIFAWGSQGYTFTLSANGRPFLGKVGVNSSSGGNAIRDLDWHHVAVTKQAGNVSFYVDGVPAGFAFVNQFYEFSGPVAIGGLGTPFSGETYSFLGRIDEVVVFNRPLSEAEIRVVAEKTAQVDCDAIISSFSDVPGSLDIGDVADLNLSITSQRRGMTTNLVVVVPSGSSFRSVSGQSASGSFEQTNNALRWRKTPNFLRPLFLFNGKNMRIKCV